jgi:TolB protein
MAKRKIENLNKIIFSALAFIAFSFMFWASGPSRKTYTPVKQAVTDLQPAVTPDARELTRITNDNLQEIGASISPDGKKILYFTIDPMQIGANQYHINLKTLGEQGVSPLLTSGCLQPSWMPDSKGFYFKYAVASKPVISKSKIENGGISYVSPNNNGEDDNFPNILRASNKILFGTSIGNSVQVATVDQNGLNFTILAEGRVPFSHPIENSFVFEKRVGNFWHIFTYDINTGQQTQLTIGDQNNGYARISPDGKWVVFKRDFPKSSAHIMLMNMSGSNVKQLTTGNTWNERPEFGADGYIYFSSNAGNTDPYRKYDNFDIWRVKPNLQ